MTSFDNTEELKAFDHFLTVIKTLRAPGGCPWDLAQTPLTMRKDIIEESYEAVDAITEENPDHACEELGDVVLNANMVSLMYQQNGDFEIARMYNELAEKLIRRHPHVFPQSEGASQVKENADTADKVLSQWDRIKENVEGRKEESVLDTVPKSFPPLLYSLKIQKKAVKKGFDWRDNEGAKAKVKEEWDELHEAVAEGDLDHMEEEFGDLLFILVNYARKLGVDASLAMNRANKKFYRRFTYVEKKMKEAGIEMTQDNLEKMDEFWDEAKKIERETK